MKSRCWRDYEIRSVSAHSHVLCSSLAIAFILLSLIITIRCSIVLKYTQASNLAILSLPDPYTWIMDTLISICTFDIFSISTTIPLPLAFWSMSGRPNLRVVTSLSSITIVFKLLMEIPVTGAGTYGVFTCLVSLAFFFQWFFSGFIFLINHFLLWLLLFLLFRTGNLRHMNLLSILIWVIFRE